MRDECVTKQKTKQKKHSHKHEKETHCRLQDVSYASKMR